MLQFLRDNLGFLAAGVLLTFASSFGQTYFISVFAGEIQGDFGLTHGEWGGIYAVGTTASAIVMVWAGTLTDHFRVRVLAPLALIGLALACVAMTIAPGWVALMGVIFALRFFGQGMLSHIAIVAMARWYVARRGRALSIAGLGYAVGEAFLPLMFVAFLGMTSWKNLWLVAAGICILLVPIILRLLRLERTPQSAASRDEAAGMRGEHWTRIQAMKHPLFWMMAPAVIGPSAFITALFFQQVHTAQSKGWAHADLVAVFPIYTAVSICVMLLTGWALDRYGTARLLPFCQLPLAAGFAVIWATDGIAGAALGFALIGGSHGAYSTLFNAFWAEFYGTRFLGGIKSLATAFMVLGSAMGPGITGFAIDRGVDFPDQTLVIGGYFILVSALIWIGVSRAKPLLPRAA